MAPNGDLIVCEDGEDDERVVGITPAGRLYTLARNAHNESEFAGACFSPDGQTLFVNIQEPGHHVRDLGSVGAAAGRERGGCPGRIFGVVAASPRRRMRVRARKFSGSRLSSSSTRSSGLLPLAKFLARPLQIFLCGFTPMNPACNRRRARQERRCPRKSRRKKFLRRPSRGVHKAPHRSQRIDSSRANGEAPSLTHETTERSAMRGQHPEGVFVVFAVEHAAAVWHHRTLSSLREDQGGPQ